MNYQSPNVEESRTSRKKKSGKRTSDETFANLDCAGAARTRLIAEELIEQLTRAQIGDLSDQGSVDRLDHLNISLQLLAPAPTAQPNLSTITANSKEAHKLVRDLEESVNGRRGQRAQRRAESSLRLAAITQNDAERLLNEGSAALPATSEQDQEIKSNENQIAPTPVDKTGLQGALARKTEKRPEMKSLGSLLKRPAATNPQEIIAPPKEKEEISAPQETAAAVDPPQQIEINQIEQAEIAAQPIEQQPTKHEVEQQVEEELELNALMPAPPEVRNTEAQKISKANWQAAKEIAGGKESGALLLNIISEPERAMTDMLRQAKWTLKKWTE